jgi:AcrR family transcriptional regulator
MGRKPVKKIRRDDSAVKQEWLETLAPMFLSQGFRHMGMDQVIHTVGVSKATFYKYFSSREMLVSEIIETKLAEIAQFKDALFEFGKPFHDRYIHALEIVGRALQHISGRFLEDVQQAHPELWESIDSFKKFSLEWLEQFYLEGMRDGHLKPQNPKVIVLADRAFLRSLTNSNELRACNLDMQEAFMGYFTMKAQGIFQEPTTVIRAGQTLASAVASNQDA